jgi:hypothetical protein
MFLRSTGVFPGQEVTDAIDGSERFPAHFVGDMPMWGAQFQEDASSPDQEAVRRRIFPIWSTSFNRFEEPTVAAACH